MKLTKSIIILSLIYLAACSINHHKRLRKSHTTLGAGAEPWVIFDAGSSGTRLYLVDMSTFLTNYKESAKVESQFFRLSDVLDKSKSMGECILGEESKYGTVPANDDNTPQLKAKFYGECLGEKIKQALTIGKIKPSDKVKKIIIESTAGARQSRGSLTKPEYDEVQAAVKEGIQSKCGDLCEKNSVHLTILSGRFEGLYGYLSAFLSFKSGSNDNLKADKYKANALYMEVGGASIQYSFGLNNEAEFNTCIAPHLQTNKDCLSKSDGRRFHKIKQSLSRKKKGIVDFKWETKNKELQSNKQEQISIFSKSFLGNANNELVNLLEASGYYKFCSRFLPDYDTSKKIPKKSTELQKLFANEEPGEDYMIKKDSKGMLFVVKSEQTDEEGKKTTTYVKNDKYDYKKCYNIIEKVRELRDTTQKGQRFKCQWDYLNAATACGKMNENTNTLIINNNGPKNLLRGTTSFENLGKYNDAIFEKCKTDSSLETTIKIPAEFIANACLYSMYSVNQISRHMHTKKEDFKGKIEIVKSADWYVGSLYFQKNANQNSEQWELDDTNQKEDDRLTLNKVY